MWPILAQIDVAFDPPCGWAEVGLVVLSPSPTEVPHMRLRSSFAIVAVLASLGLSGCDDTTTSPATAGEPATPSAAMTPPSLTDPSDPSTPPSPTAPTDPSSPTSPTAGGTTPPGTELSFGEPAVVEVYADAGEARIEYAVSNVEVSESPLGPVAQITINVRAIDDVTGSFVMAMVDWQGVDASGKPTVLGFADGCDDELPVEAVGETGTMCVAVQMTTDESTLAEVHYEGSDYRENPIIWKP